MESKEASSDKLRKWVTLYFISLIIAVGYFAIYTGYSVFLFEPERREVVLNQINAIYSEEDLGTTTVTEGEVKQFVVKMIDAAFTYDYLSFAHDDLYEDILARNVETDLPDHRDLVQNLFSEEAHKKFIADLKDTPWSNGFYHERRFVKATILSPPVKDTYTGWQKGSDGRLNMSYTGYFFVVAKAYQKRTMRFRVNYEVVAERKPNPVGTIRDTYYFFPLVPQNTFEWQIKSFKWDVERSM
tara:strand:+ start:82 stop:807 length:726 start_codon:yes stop_codon:yes gene_type:complete